MPKVLGRISRQELPPSTPSSSKILPTLYGKPLPAFTPPPSSSFVYVKSSRVSPCGILLARLRFAGIANPYLQGHSTSPNDHMPHSEKHGMGEPTMNGEGPLHSLFLSHLTSYPMINDSIETFKSIPIGQKSISLADQGYCALVKPVQPYLSKPYNFVHPYVSKADSLADSTLKQVDSRFPIVKEPTDKIKDTVSDYAYFPLRIAGDGRDYLFKVYGNEYRRAGGDKGGLVAKGKAGVTTSLVVTSEILAWLSSYLGQKKEQTKDVVNEKVNN
ncbi:hypothetical protein FGG08_002843 [Glutinoglossum americanum]|uniref:Uncharacterized protein n=1 Tax=Glutinoglossum americanum TaxID=1670608 RepID=A0A9P8I8H5_9PEZI|nr:hypothetical protein FGG08_002843 [Glutinoglossum americanum]